MSILDSDGACIMHISFIRLDGELFPRLEISCGNARCLVVSAEKDGGLAEANHGGRRRWCHLRVWSVELIVARGNDKF